MVFEQTLAIIKSRARDNSSRRDLDIETRLITGGFSYQVLVVDDIATIRVVLSRLLERMGHRVQTVDSGKQALIILNEFRADVIVSDLSMPEMDGYQFVRLLRQRPDTRLRFIVAMTANGEDSSEQASFEAGFDAHWTKPFDLALIHRTLADRNIRSARDEFA